MGNTKQIYFQGRVSNDDKDNPFFSPDIEKTLLEIAHGDHAVVQVYKEGYLYLNKSNESFVIGALTSHSISGFNVIEFVETHLKDCAIIARDVELSGIKVVLSYGSEKQLMIYEPKAHKGRQKQ